jgi:hypothetical protein
MRNVFAAAVVAGMLVPVAGYAAEATGKVKTWDATTKVVTLEDNTGCALGAAINAPAGIGPGKDVVLVYTTIGTVNTCTEVKVK